MRKYCYRCGARLRDGAKFCQECGAKLGEDTGEVLTVIPSRASSAVPLTAEAANTDASGVRDLTAGNGSGTTASVSTMPLVVFDVALLVLVTFLPWVSSYYAEKGSGLSLPGLAKEGIHYISTLSQYSAYASQYGADALYKNALGVLILVSLVAGIGWFSSVVSLYYDAKYDLKAERSSGGGSKIVAGLAVIVQVLVWIGVAYLKSSLANDYFDVSYALEGVVETTIWVWISFAASIGSHFLRRSIYQNLGWANSSTSPSQDRQAI